MLDRLVARLKRVEDPTTRAVLLHTRGSFHWVARGHLVRRRVIARYLGSTIEPRLQVGAGAHRLDGWLNSDLIAGDIYLDLSRRLPFSDRSFTYVFGEHVIEHVSETTGERLLAELYRILRPGGVLRLTTPDLQKLLAIYEDRNPVVNRDAYIGFLSDLAGKPLQRACQAFNHHLRAWGHRYIYDEDDLVAKMLERGFTDARRCEPGESSHEALRGLDQHGAAEWINRAEAMSIEARRPPE